MDPHEVPHLFNCTAHPNDLSPAIQNPFLTAQSTQIKSVISVPIKDFIHHYPRALINDIPGSGRTFTTYPGRDALLRHTRVGAQFNDLPESPVTCEFMGQASQDDTGTAFSGPG